MHPAPLYPSESCIPKTSSIEASKAHSTPSCIPTEIETLTTQQEITRKVAADNNSKALFEKIADCITESDTESVKKCIEELKQLPAIPLDKVLSTKNYHGESLLRIAITAMNIETLQAVIDLYKEQPQTLETILDISNNEEGSYLLWAIKSGNNELLQVMIILYKEYPTLLTKILTTNQEGNCCFISAIEAKNPKILPVILKLYETISPEALINLLKDLINTDDIKKVVSTMTSPKTGLTLEFLQSCLALMKNNQDWTWLVNWTKLVNQLENYIISCKKSNMQIV